MRVRKRWDYGTTVVESVINFICIKRQSINLRMRAIGTYGKDEEMIREVREV
jgi:hypothetical protein